MHSMGFSPGEFFDIKTGETIHWELRNGDLYLWSAGELQVILHLTQIEAEKCLDQLRLLLDMCK